MKFSLKHAVLAAAVALGSVSAANAASFFNVQILGSTDDVNFSNNVSVTPGETVYYEVVGQLAPAGTTNNTHPYTLGTQIAGTDGVQSLTFSLDDANAGYITNASVASSFLGGTGSGPISGSTVGGYFAAQASGVYVGATAPVTIATGSLSAGSSSDTLSASDDFSDGFNAAVKFLPSSGSSKTFISTSTGPGGADGSDPYFGYSALTLSENVGSSVPAPGVASGMGALMAGLGFLGFLRRRQIA